MSHTVTVTRTTTSSNTSAIILNTGYCKTTPGILKIAQVILGGIIVGLMYYNFGYVVHVQFDLFFYMMAVTFFIGSVLLLLGCLFSISTGVVIAKTSYEFIYHGGAFILYLIATLLLLNELHKGDFNRRYYESYNYCAKTTVAFFGVILTILYFISTALAYRAYRWP